jgi:hypothetical protein
MKEGFAFVGKLSELVTLSERTIDAAVIKDVTVIAVNSPRIVKPLDESIIEHIAQVEWQLNNTRKESHKRNYKYHK